MTRNPFYALIALSRLTLSLTFFLTFYGLLATRPQPASAALLPTEAGVEKALLPEALPDTAEARKRAQLAHVKRVVVIPPFFGTDTLSKTVKPADGSKTSSDPKPPGDTQTSANTKSDMDKTETKAETKREDDRDKNQAGSSAANPNLLQYASYLKKLQDDAQKVLPLRLAKRAGFEVVPEAEVLAALNALLLTPETMFENKGRIKGSKFPLPLAAAIRSLSQALHADAVVLAVLDEPRRANGKYLFDPFSGLSYSPGHVEAHGGFYLMLPEGTEVLHGYMRVQNPLSKAGGHDFVLPDWIDAQNLMIENLMDEWSYYTPKK